MFNSGELEEMMRPLGRFMLVILFLLISGMFLVSCKEKKEGKVTVTGQEYVLRRDSDNSWVMDVKGKVKNIGSVDVKNITITGYCRSCQQAWLKNQWFVSDIEKTAEEKDIVNYLPIGAEQEFKFKGIAYYYGYQDKQPANLPEKLEVVIESLETVN